MGYDAQEFHPIEIIYGQAGLSASIYRCRDKDGLFYVIEFNRSGYYRQQFVTTKHFRKKHLLGLANLARRTHLRIQELKTRDSKIDT